MSDGSEWRTMSNDELLRWADSYKGLVGGEVALGLAHAKALRWFSPILEGIGMIDEEMISLPADEVLHAALLVEDEWGRGSQLGEVLQAFLDANRKRAEEWCNPRGWVEELDGPRGEKPALVRVAGV